MLTAVPFPAWYPDDVGADLLELDLEAGAGAVDFLPKLKSIVMRAGLLEAL
jgi:hypothetical protein